MFECPRPNSHMYQGILTRKPFTMLNRLLNPNLLSLCSKMSRWMRNYKKRCNSHVVCLCKDVLQLCFTSAEQKPSWLSLFAPSFCVQQVILYMSYMWDCLKAKCYDSVHLGQLHYFMFSMLVDIPELKEINIYIIAVWVVVKCLFFFLCWFFLHHLNPIFHRLANISVQS